MSIHFTANDARRLMKENESPDKYVDEILLLIKKAAEKNESSLKTYACDFGSSSLYGGKPTELQQKVLVKLSELGFKTQIMCEERQFVDIYLLVQWEE